MAFGTSMSTHRGNRGPARWTGWARPERDGSTSPQRRPVRPNAPRRTHPGRRRSTERGQTGRWVAFDARPGAWGSKLRTCEECPPCGLGRRCPGAAPRPRPCRGGPPSRGPGPAGIPRRRPAKDLGHHARHVLQTKNRSACNASASRAPQIRPPVRASWAVRQAEYDKALHHRNPAHQSTRFARTRRPTSATSTAAARWVPSVG